MKVLVIIFIIIAAISSLSSMGYVVVDIVVEKYKKSQLVVAPAAPAPAAPAPVAPVPEPEPEVVVVEQVDHINAEEADKLLSDDLAMSNVKRESGTGSGYRALVNIGVINKHYNSGEVVTLADLKAKGLIEKKAGRVKVLADGVLEKALTIKADSFSIQAIKMIELTGGTPIILE